MTSRIRIIPYNPPYAPRRIHVKGHGFCVDQEAAIAYLRWCGAEVQVAADGALCWREKRVDAIFVNGAGWVYPLEELR